jgi:hypothetical protein
MMAVVVHIPLLEVAILQLTVQKNIEVKRRVSHGDFELFADLCNLTV